MFKKLLAVALIASTVSTSFSMKPQETKKFKNSLKTKSKDQLLAMKNLLAQQKADVVYYFSKSRKDETEEAIAHIDSQIKAINTELAYKYNYSAPV